MDAKAPDKVLDCLHMLCPLPILKVSKAIKEIEIGQTLLLIADDPGAKPDMETWARRTGQGMESFEQQGKEMRFLIRRTK